MRAAAGIIGLLDGLLCVVIAGGLFFTSSDTATKGLDSLAGYLVTALFLITGLPALLLVWRDTRPGLALTFAIAFPAAFVILFVGAVIAFA